MAPCLAADTMGASAWNKIVQAEKNLLKIFCSNRSIDIKVVNNRTGHIFLAASSLEKHMKESLKNTWDKTAARATAGLLVRRAREVGQQQVTYERGVQRYDGKVKTVIETLREHGMEFIQYAGKRPPRRPWDGKINQAVPPGPRGLATPRQAKPEKENEGPP